MKYIFNELYIMNNKSIFIISTIITILIIIGLITIGIKVIKKK